RRIQLQQALDKEEEDLNRDIYDVDQFLAKWWMKSCWRELGRAGAGDLVLTCFRHTKIVPRMTSNRRSRREADKLLNDEIIECLNRHRVRDPMNIDDFVCNGADRDTAMESLTKKELLSDSTGLPFIDRAWDEPDDDADTASVQSDTEQTTQEKMDAIRSVIFMLLEHQDIDVKLLRDLRKLQLRIGINSAVNKTLKLPRHR
ncbi:hypothetical protein F443_04085, partial [Phytophthora nicotianae P1569]